MTRSDPVTAPGPEARASGDRASSRAKEALVGCAVLSSALLAAALVPMQQQRFPPLAAAALAAGLAGWAIVAWKGSTEARESGAVAAAGTRPAILLLLASIGFAAAAWMRTSGNSFRPGGAPAWVAAAGFWFAAWWPRRDPVLRSGTGPVSPRARWAVAAALAAIFLCGILVYFHDLSGPPANPTSDHAETLLDLKDVLDGQRPIFFPRNTGREPWKFYFLYVLVRVFGLPANYLTLKVGTVLIGLLGIPAIFLLGTELGGPALGLFAAALLATADWPLAMARLGIRVSYAVFPTALAMWAMLRYLRRGDRGSVLAAGAAMGVGFYGYIPARAVPLLLPVVGLVALLDGRWRGHRRRLAGDAALALATSGIVFLPLGHFMIERPDLFWMRALSRTGEKAGLGASLSTFAGNLRNMALAFHWRGDGTWVNEVQNAPFLTPAAGALLLAGLLLAAALVWRGGVRWLVPLSALFLLTLASTLSLTYPLENPSVNRSVAVVPAVFVLAALPLAFLVRASSGSRRARMAASVMAGALVLVAARESWERYFVTYARQYDLLVEHSIPIARAIQAEVSRGVPLRQAFVINKSWIDPRNLAFELGNPAWAANEVPTGAPVPDRIDRPLLFVYRGNDEEARSAIRRLYPGSREVLHPENHPDRSFVVVRVD